ncbi:hypothetical protein WH96_20070 [Kiloniella spongiae]|uniref:Uncharacterized protein n=1 Tax=Kiloniella spongiae TaxID=1489064 RepID=A0A0H2MA19_9PROT|nr:hypothetical protein [Kiloniella spongiae]KLN58991.1 hypothetical protein WH96_20070 [Kiloniella spongiae]
MAAKKNPLKLNKLQLRTLVLAQVIGRDERQAVQHPNGDVTLSQLPHAHGDHVHVGEFVVSAKDASGFNNPAVWIALARKGLVKEAGQPITLTTEGVAYETGLGDKFLEKSDH